MKSLRIELKWAGIFTAMIAGWMLLEKSLGLHGPRIAHQPVFGALVLLPALLLYFSALREKRRSLLPASMSYGRAFRSGLVLTVFLVALSPLNQLLFGIVLSPEFFALAARHAVQSSALTEADAAARFNLPSFIVAGIAGGLATGAVFSAFAALFIRTKSQTNPS